MALVTGDDYEDLVEWVDCMAHDAAAHQIREVLGMNDDIRALCKAIGKEAAESFENMLVNRYGED